SSLPYPIDWRDAMPEIPTPDAPVSQRALLSLLRQRSVLPALEVFHAALGDVFAMPLPGFNPIMLAGPEANHFVLVEKRGELHWRARSEEHTSELQSRENL